MNKIVQGKIIITSKGDGYLKLLEHHEDIDEYFTEGEYVFIDRDHLNTALHGDIAEVEVLGMKRNEKTEVDTFYGKVLRIIERAKYAHSGKLEEENNTLFLVPDDKKTYTDFIIEKDKTLGAKPGDKVVVEITHWTDHKRSPFAKVIKILGKPGDNNAEMLAFALERGFSDKPREDVLKEAEALYKRGITEEDKILNENGIDGRRDFRNITTFTIDPPDAKDFDDAISIRKLENNNYEIGIHIADVSFYLKEDTKMDEEAVFRETSVYLVDRTIPMLPEVLSNDLCSLKEGEERLAFSAVFEMTEKAKIVKEWYGKTIIKSNKSLTYNDAQKSIETGKGDFAEEINILNNLAKILEKEKKENGALEIESQEVKFKLDKKGVPIDVFLVEIKEANKLIEEFMLLANRKVSKFINDEQKKNNAPEISIYRIHNKPESEKMHELALFIKSLNENVRFIDGLIPTTELNNLFLKLKEEGREAEKDLLSLHVTRSMQKAIYSTKNIGHYGLAFPYYSHFTSPIRRYPDILLHRILFRILNKDFPKAEEKYYFDRMCDLASKREKEAQDAERGSVKYKQTEYMSYRIGKEFEGVVSGISQWGIYVEEAKSKAEGMIRLKDLGTDFYVYNSKLSKIIGENSGEEWRIGDRVKIRVKATNLDLRQIDYELLQ